MDNKEVKLDLKDKKLLHLLDFNARMPYSQIAKTLNISKQGAEYKIKNLMKKGVIKGFYPVINVPKMGYLYCRLCFVLKSAPPEKEQEIIEYLRNDNRFFWVFTAQGVYDLLIVMWAKSISEFKEGTNDFLSKYGKYIKLKNESLTTDVIHYQHRYLLNIKETKEIHIKETKELVEINNTEKEILKILCEDARIPVVKIAEKLKISPKVVSYAIKKLEKIKIIEGYRPIIDHNKLGYTYYKLWINIHYESISEIKKLYEYIKNNSIVLYVVKGVGLPEDLDVEVMVKTNQELFNFVKDLKIKFPNLIEDYRTFMFIDTKKVRYLPF